MESSKGRDDISRKGGVCSKSDSGEQSNIIGFIYVEFLLTFFNQYQSAIALIMLLNKFPQKSMAINSEHLFPCSWDCSLADVYWAQLGGSVSHYELAGIDSTLEQGLGLFYLCLSL